MVDYVLRLKNVPNGIKNSKNVGTECAARDIEYAKFLKQKPTLDMFLPIPKGQTNLADGLDFKCSLTDFNTALDNLAFKDCEYIGSNGAGVETVLVGNIKLYFKNGVIISDLDCIGLLPYKSLEDLVDYNFELTNKKAKDVGL